MMDRHSYLLLLPLSCAIWLQNTPETYATIITGGPARVECWTGGLRSPDTTTSYFHDFATSRAKRGQEFVLSSSERASVDLGDYGIDQCQRELVPNILARELSVAARDVSMPPLVCATIAQVSSESFPFEISVSASPGSLFPLTAINRRQSETSGIVPADFMLLTVNL
jgi:hypothetical protein